MGVRGKGGGERGKTPRMSNTTEALAPRVPRRLNTGTPIHAVLGTSEPRPPHCSPLSAHGTTTAKAPGTAARLAPLGPPREQLRESRYARGAATTRHDQPSVAPSPFQEGPRGHPGFPPPTPTRRHTDTHTHAARHATLGGSGRIPPRGATQLAPISESRFGGTLRRAPPAGSSARGTVSSTMLARSPSASSCEGTRRGRRW